MWTEKKQYNAKKTVIFLNFEKCEPLTKPEDEQFLNIAIMS
jgi:hypothetical protein